jgi:hypothetical protein
MAMSEHDRRRAIYWLNIYLWSSLIGFVALCAVQYWRRYL